MPKLSNLSLIFIYVGVGLASRFRSRCSLGPVRSESCAARTLCEMASKTTQHQQKVDKLSRKTKHFRFHLCTWNVAWNDPTEDFTEVLYLKAKPLPDAYAIGLQEAGQPNSNVVTHIWTVALTDALSPRGYVRVKSIRLQGLMLLLFVRVTHLLHLTNIESEFTRTGLAGFWGNKGGVSIRMDVNGINTCIVNCHLAAHQDEVGERIEDFYTIVENQRFRDKDVDFILDHDYVFWIGDLNFRLDDLKNEEVMECIKKREYSKLWPYDQLNKSREDGVIFLDFDEGPLDFPPTYKFDLGTDTYDTSKKSRKPAWCDRILWMVHEDAFEGIELEAKQLNYTSHTSYTLSDHKPVTALFDIVVLAHPRPSPVTFVRTSRWYKTSDNTVTYRVEAGMAVSGWDWIGLFRVSEVLGNRPAAKPTGKPVTPDTLSS
ncbi:inositol polyphosphate 5-phosphatase K-like isoform X2 [Liolophura sinensis]|uniref:inositol polyphosphate 5-phosphatase K-like isoform X2 n=1 Tax=Liolophura sinensis TaxID=3198878 RepID=UPI003159287C